MTRVARFGPCRPLQRPHRPPALMIVYQPGLYGVGLAAHGGLNHLNHRALKSPEVCRNHTIW